MTKTVLSFLYCLLILQSSSQQFYIRGRVSDVETQQPLKGASVYINNTTRGTTTNANGDFELGPFSPGRYEVIASFVGYESLLCFFISDTTPNVKLLRKRLQDQ